ncbi:MAG: type II toxin-antitoxin system RelE/ParE family toxin [Hyphomicrobium aestuarii]|nr:type II toxin-antitoxin system RelE/ParE family toxin [Hyphomicrobium aestuarii]
MRIRLTRLALADPEDIVDHLEAVSPKGASNVQARVNDVLDLISRHPFAGTVTNDQRLRRMTTSPYPYLIFYEVTELSIIVHAIRHGARDTGSMSGLK